MAKHLLIGSLCLTVGITFSHAQSGSPEPRFEVASIRPAVSRTPGSGPRVQVGRVDIHSDTLHHIIWTAYGGNRTDFLRMPGWAESETFDIVARGNASSVDETAAMLRTLLRERFALSMHREEQLDDAYIVTRISPERLGSQLRPSSSDCSPKPWCTGRLTRGHNIGTGVRWDYLLERLTAAVGRPLVDKTGLSGFFDFELTWAPGLPLTPEAGVDVFQALREQLGLKFESAKAAKDVWVVDHVERPSPN